MNRLTFSLDLHGKRWSEASTQVSDARRQKIIHRNMAFDELGNIGNIAVDEPVCLILNSENLHTKDVSVQTWIDLVDWIGRNTIASSGRLTNCTYNDLRKLAADLMAKREFLLWELANGAEITIFDAMGLTIKPMELRGELGMD